MKKILYSTAGLMGLLGLVSCSSQEEPSNVGADGVVITVRLPHGMDTRATTFGDGTEAGDNVTLDNLEWTVFEIVDGTPVKVYSDSKGAFSSSQTEETVSLPLAKGKTYQVSFYADDSANGFSTYADGVVSVDYSKGASNDASEDAFVGKSAVFTVDGAYTESVTLTRPFAQLNWGTDDTGAKSIAPIIGTLTGTVTVKSGLYTGFDILGGKVDPATAVSTPVSFAAVGFSSLPEQKFPIEQQPNAYSLIAMNYLLTGDGTIDCELAFNNGLDAVAVNGATVAVNHRTNIYGSLLTSPADFNIVVNNNFDLPNNDVEQATKVTTPDELLDAVANAKDGDELSLAADMDLSSTGPITIDKSVTLSVPAGVTVTTARQGNTANFVVASGATVKLTGEGTYSGDNRIFDVDGTLVVDGPDFSTSTKTRGSIITVNVGGNLTIDSGTLTAANTGLWIEGTATINGGTIHSNNSASDPEVGSGWAYCVRVLNADADLTINGGEISGVQGAVANVNGKLTVNDGYLHTNPLFTSSDNYYAVYIGDGSNSVTTLNGGKFYAENQKSVYFAKQYGDNAPNVLNLNGGEYNNQGIEIVKDASGATASSGILTPSAGYEWKAIDDGVFKFEVVAQ